MSRYWMSVPWMCCFVEKYEIVQFSLKKLDLIRLCFEFVWVLKYGILYNKREVDEFFYVFKFAL